MSVAGRITRWGFALALLFFVTQCIGIHLPGEEFVFFLIIGWLPFLAHVGPKVHVRWDAIVSTAIYAAIFVAGAHYFLRWLFREMSREGRQQHWRWSWTICGFVIVLLMFTAGMAAIGIVHQTAWLASSKAPLYEPYGAIINRIRCNSNLRQIGLAISNWAENHHGKLPDDFSEVFESGDLMPENFICPASDDQIRSGQRNAAPAANLLQPGACSYIYLGKGLTQPLQPSHVIAVEPLENHKDAGINVLFADWHVEWLDRPQAESLLLGLGFRRVETDPDKQTNAANP